MTSQDPTELPPLIRVGDTEKKWITPLNNELYLAAAEIMEDTSTSIPCTYVKYSELGAFIDWLEEHYTIQKK